MARSLAAASEEEAAQAAAGLLPRHGAVDAVVAGVFAAAAAHAGVLLGPVQMLVAGAGTGPRAIDGRTRQPGKGTKRPRGFRAEDAIPPASRVAVPALPAALAAALATFGTVTLSRALEPAIEIAKRVAPARAELFVRFRERGPRLSAGAIGAELVAAGGPMEGGLLTREDLDELRPEVVVVKPMKLGVRPVLTVPWRGAALQGDGSHAELDARHTHVVAAIDGRGTLAIACYEVPLDGVEVAPLQLLAPFAAAPVLRGEPRVRPGAPLAAAAPLALVEVDGAFAIAVGIAQLARAEGALVEWLAGDDPVGRAGPAEGRVVGLARGAAGVSSLGGEGRG
jgi:Gamma-glutamyltranspeptidase